MDSSYLNANVNYRRKLPWQVVHSAHKVDFLSFGVGDQAVVVIPGLEGSGESCLHLVMPVVKRLNEHKDLYRVLLVDYSCEEHRTIDALCTTVTDGLRAILGKQKAVLWAQSFGNLLGTAVINRAVLDLERAVCVSPFSNLPNGLMAVSSYSMYVTPTFLYRHAIAHIGRWVFGPCGENRNHPFFDALTNANSGQVRRRTAWLIDRNFFRQYEALDIPTKIWLGSADRLPSITDRISEFEAISQVNNHVLLALLAGSGHVVLPNPQITLLIDEVAQWITRSTASST